MVKFNVFLIIGGVRFSSYSLGEINKVCTKVRRNGLNSLNYSSKYF